MKRKDGWIKTVIVILTLVLAVLLGIGAFSWRSSTGNGKYQMVPVPKTGVGQERESQPGPERQDSGQQQSLGHQDSGQQQSPGQQDSGQQQSPGSQQDLGQQQSPAGDGFIGDISQTGEEMAQSTQSKAGVTLLFAGDVLLSDHVLNAYDRAGGIKGVLDDGIRSEIALADIFMVNQEFPFTDRGTAAADKQYTFRLPPSRVNLLKEMDIDLVTLANNHILDFGTDGLLDSGTALDGAGIAYVGAGENLKRAKQLATVVKNGRTIGFLGASRVYMDAVWAATDSRPGVLSTYDPKQLVAEIQEARSQCDYLVVYVHWGIERDTRPQEYQRTLARAYIDAGVDLVVGSHPHVLQGVEYYKGRPIVYSLGNFVFGSSIPKTALLKVELGEEGARLSMLPCTSSGGFTRLLTGRENALEFSQFMTKLSFDVTFDENGYAAGEP